MDKTSVHMADRMHTCADPTPSGATVTIKSSSVDVAAEALASLAATLNMTELASLAEFDDEVAAAREALAAVGDARKVFLKMRTDAADATGAVKTLVRMLRPPHC
jgi:Ciliary BBSome complex subunit 2, C-terminal